MASLEQRDLVPGFCAETESGPLFQKEAGTAAQTEQDRLDVPGAQVTSWPLVKQPSLQPDTATHSVSQLRW